MSFEPHKPTVLICLYDIYFTLFLPLLFLYWSGHARLSFRSLLLGQTQLPPDARGPESPGWSTAAPGRLAETREAKHSRPSPVKIPRDRWAHESETESQAQLRLREPPRNASLPPCWPPRPLPKSRTRSCATNRAAKPGPDDAESINPFKVIQTLARAVIIQKDGTLNFEHLEAPPLSTLLRASPPPCSYLPRNPSGFRLPAFILYLRPCIILLPQPSFAFLPRFRPRSGSSTSHLTGSQTAVAEHGT